MFPKTAHAAFSGASESLPRGEAMAAFVRFPTEALSYRQTEGTAGHSRRRDGAVAGVWNCELVTETPLSIQSYFRHARQAGDAAFIPGTSLRGMVRNTMEMLGAGCPRLYRGTVTGPPHFRTCRPERTCLACHIFGFVEERTEFAWQGKVSFSDTDNAARRWIQLNVPIAPGPATGNGWLTFRHGPAPTSPGRVWCVERGERFRFTVEYEDLDAEEYAVLKLALTLRHGETHLCHKLGYGKSAGLGSCRISIENDPSPPGPEIDRYVRLPGFQDLIRLRSCI
jgi:hypothetical protein